MKRLFLYNKQTTNNTATLHFTIINRDMEKQPM